MRRAPKRAEASPAGPVIAPDAGFLKRRRLALQALGIKSIGPAAPEPDEPPIPPGPTDSYDMNTIEHHRVVRDELAAIDARRSDIAQALAAHAADAHSYKHQELRIEKSQLLLLRREVEKDLGAHPLGNDSQREYIRSRAESLREQLWRNSERLSAGGEHRHARQRRIDSLRARHLAEHEIGLRSSLSGY